MVFDLCRAAAMAATSWRPAIRVCGDFLALPREARKSPNEELAAGGLGVSSRTVWRWVRQARAGEGLGRRPRGRFLVTDEIRQRLAFWRGNAAAVHRELVEAARNGGPVAPSLSTLQRAVARDLLAGDRAGLAGGERARRPFDVFLQRPRTHRNAVWEADHVEAAVEVDVEGRLLKPWVTWFVDAGTNVVCGTAVTPGPASRESILAGLRAAITLEAPYGPPGGLPERVRIDRGKDFLSRTVASVLAGFAVPLTVSTLPFKCGMYAGKILDLHRSGRSSSRMARSIGCRKGQRRGCSSCNRPRRRPVGCCAEGAQDIRRIGHRSHGTAASGSIVCSRTPGRMVEGWRSRGDG